MSGVDYETQLFTLVTVYYVTNLICIKLKFTESLPVYVSNDFAFHTVMILTDIIVADFVKALIYKDFMYINR